LHPAYGASRWALDSIVSTVLGDRKKGAPRRVYVSRSGAPHRRLANEAACGALLRDRLGFELVDLRVLSVAEQAVLFFDAEAVVGVHGSGLSNLVFCAPGTRVLEVFSPLYGSPAYYQIAERLGLEYRAALGDDDLVVPREATGFSSQHAARDVSILPERLLEEVAALLSGR
jgi:capsular polysaccharide biosynthesis protein